MSDSALYEGWVTHRRRGPVEHAFRYRALMTLLDLDELPGALDRHPLWSARRPAPVRFRRRDHLGDPDASLAEAARDLVEERTGARPAGPVRLLTTPRFFGIGFNPVSFFYLYGADRGRVEAVIAEVTNTPWGERHTYVLDGRGGSLEGTFTKRLHVSPFMPMEQTYRWRLSEPGDDLGVSISSREGGSVVFEAALGLRRRELSRAQMSRAMLAHPPAAAATLARIYWNALKLKLKGAPYHPRPAAS
jgi:uncharacterized protein